MKIHLRSLGCGCTASLYEVSLYRKVLEKKGYGLTDSIDEADTVVLNTCGFSSDMEAKALQAISELQAKYPEKRVVVGGCLPKINPAALTTVFTGPTFRPEKFDELLRAVGDAAIPLSQEERQVVYETTCHLDSVDFKTIGFKFRIFYAAKWIYDNLGPALGFANPFLDNHFKSTTVNNTKYLVYAARGCLGYCTYCSIRKSRGSIVSTSLDQVKREVSLAAAKGRQDIVLLGEDLGAWGQDIGSNVSVLLNEVTDNCGDCSIIIPFFEPSWLVRYFDELKPVFAKKKIISIYIPFQSASPRVLKRMGRHYPLPDVARRVLELKKQDPNLLTKTHLMHSFPGETWGDFFQSMRYGMNFDFVAAFRYSQRPGTSAARLPDQIPEYQKAIRNFIAGNFFLAWNIFCALRGSVRSRIASQRNPGGPGKAREIQPTQ